MSSITVNAVAPYTASGTPAAYGSASAADSSAKASALSPEQLEKRERMEKQLWYWNLACGILHLVQAAAVLGIGLGSTSAAKFKLPLITTFVTWNGGPQTQLVYRTYSFPFCAVTSGFSWMSALAHFLVLAFYSRYIADLRKGLNQFRWMEYAFSSSLMICLIAMLFTIYDICLLVVIGCINGTMNFFGWGHEILNAGRAPKDVDWRMFLFGTFAGIVPWAIILAYIGSLAGAGNLPGFVWGILVSYFVVFWCFPGIMIAQYRQWRWCGDARGGGFPGAGYYNGEKAYQVASLVAKSLLLWLVVGGTNQPANQAVVNQ